MNNVNKKNKKIILFLCDVEVISQRINLYTHTFYDKTIINIRASI